MKTNSLLTYLLYAVLATLILAAGYKACQMQKEKQLKAKEQAEWQETLRKMYPTTDTTAGGSAYIGNEQTTVNKDGIEQDAGTTTATKPSATGGNTAAKPQTPTTTPATAQKETAPKTTTPTTTAKGGSSKTPVAGLGSGRWEVRAGTFSYVEGARERLEEVIKMGYTNAEIGKTNGGKYAIVVVMRTNDKAKAIQIGDQLEKRGIDAFVYDRTKK